MAKGDAWGTGWLVVAMVLLAAVILLAVLGPIWSWDVNVIGALGGALAGVGAAATAIMTRMDRRRDRISAVRAYAYGLNAVLPGIAAELQALKDKGESAIYIGDTARRLNSLQRELEAIDFGTLLEFDSDVGRRLTAAAQSLRIIQAKMARELVPQVGYTRGVDSLAHAAEETKTAADRLERLCDVAKH